MQGALEKIAAAAPGAETSLAESYSLSLDFFGAEMNAAAMYAVFAAVTAAFIAVNIIASSLRNRKKR